MYSAPSLCYFGDFLHDFHVIYCLFFPLSSASVVVVWPQRTEGSDALPGEPCEGLPAE